MPTTAKPLIDAKFSENVITPQYVATGVTAIIDKFTATNISASAATISIYLIISGGIPSNSNLIVKTFTLQPSETYTFPEIAGHVLAPGGIISTIASAVSAITIRASGREVS